MYPIIHIQLDTCVDDAALLQVHHLCANSIPMNIIISVDLFTHVMMNVPISIPPKLCHVSQHVLDKCVLLFAHKLLNVSYSIITIHSMVCHHDKI